MIIFTFPYSCTQTEADKHKCCREMWMKAEGMRVEETRKESEGERDKVNVRRKEEVEEDGCNSTGRRGKKGGNEKQLAVHGPLPMSEDSSLGVGWGGLRTLSPCPALYSPGYCSQINAASYPSQSAWLSRP